VIRVEPLPTYPTITIVKEEEEEDGRRYISDEDAILLAGWIQAVGDYYNNYIIKLLLPTITNVSNVTQGGITFTF